jgi:putative flippase GtrA
VTNYKKLVRQILFFGVVGLITLAIDITVTTFLYRYAHFPAFIASAIGFLSGFFFNFPVNRKRVFHHGPHDRFTIHQQVIMYISLSLFNLLATSTLVQILVSTDTLAIQYAKLAVTALIAVWNFIIFKTLIFSKKHIS